MHSPSTALVRGVGQPLYSKRVSALGNAFLYHKTENTTVTWSAQSTLRWQVQASSAAPLCKDRARRIKSAGYDTPNQKQIPHNLERVAIAFQFYNAFIYYPITLARAVNQPLYPKRITVLWHPKQRQITTQCATELDQHGKHF